MSPDRVNANITLLLQQRAPSCAVNPWTYTLYPKNSFIGSCFSCLNPLYAFVANRKEVTYRQCVERTRVAFVRCLREMQHTDDRKRVVSLGDALSSLCTAFLPYTIKERLREIDRLFVREVGKGLMGERTEEVVEAFQGKYAQYFFEGVCQKEFPHEVLQKIGEGKDLNEEESEELDEWLQLIKKNNALFLPTAFHAALSELFPQYEERIRIEQFLIHRDHSFFLKEEYEYTSWVQSLHPGMQFEGITFGKPRSFSAFQKRGFLLFDRKDNKDQMVVIGKNVFQIDMWISSLEHTSLEVLYKDPRGRFCIIEKIEKDLRHVKQYEKAIIELLQYYVEKKELPFFLDPSSLFLTKKGKVKSCFDLRESVPFDYHKLLDFISKIASRDYALCARLYQESSLADHTEAQAYVHIVREYLEYEEHQVSFGTLLSSYDLGDGAFDELKKMIEGLRELRHKHFLKIVAKYQIEDEKKKKRVHALLTHAFIKMLEETGHSPLYWKKDRHFFSAFIKKEIEVQ